MWKSWWKLLRDGREGPGQTEQAPAIAIGRGGSVSSQIFPEESSRKTCPEFCASFLIPEPRHFGHVCCPNPQNRETADNKLQIGFPVFDQTFVTCHIRFVICDNLRARDLTFSTKILFPINGNKTRRKQDCQVCRVSQVSPLETVGFLWFLLLHLPKWPTGKSFFFYLWQYFASTRRRCRH